MDRHDDLMNHKTRKRWAAPARLTAAIALAFAAGLALAAPGSPAAQQATIATPPDASGVVLYLTPDQATPNGLRYAPPAVSSSGPSAAAAQSKEASPAVQDRGHHHHLQMPPHADPERRNHLALRAIKGPKVEAGQYRLAPLTK